MSKEIVDTSGFVYKDLFGRDIKVGDYIVYAAVDGRSATMRSGRVLELSHSKPSEYSFEPIEPKITVASWSNFRAVGWGDGDEERSGRQKNVKLGFLDRLVVVPEDQVSDKIKKDLAGPVCDWSGKPVVTK
jgi:hypothetical protein